MKLNGSKQQTIKETNRALVLRAVLCRNILSRAEIARYLNLTKTTLTNIVNELLSEGLLMETDTFSQENGIGRKSIGLDLSPEAPYICGFLIQRGNLHVVLANLKGQIITDEEYRYTGTIDVDFFKNTLAELYHKVKSNCHHKILAVGISSIGELDIMEGKMLHPHGFFTTPVSRSEDAQSPDTENNFPFDFEIVKFIEDLTGLPTWLCNDATAGAVAEKLFGQGVGQDNFMYISTLNGIGAGLFLEGSIYNGAVGQNGELGHMSINFQGPRCACGNNGCLELYADIDKIVQDYRCYQHLYPDHVLYQKGKTNILDILKLTDQNDFLATAILSEYCKYLSHGIINLISQLNINHIILADSSQTSNNYFEKILSDMLNNRTFMGKNQEITVAKSAFGLDAPLYGSFCIVLDKIFNAELNPQNGGLFL